MEEVNTALNGADRAESGIARDAMTEGFPVGAVLLISVGERHIGPICMSFQEPALAGMRWMVGLLNVVSARWKGLLQPQSVAGERAYSPG